VIFRRNQDRWFREAWSKTGKKLDMGKSCVRFKKLDDVPLEVVGQAVKRVPVNEFIKHCESALERLWGARAKKAASRKKHRTPRKTKKATRRS
jgi:hypothetical protein